MANGHFKLATLSTAIFVSRILAACTGPLVIDDFSTFNIHTNKLGTWTSDDESMQSVKATGGVLSFSPKNDSTSYFYETLGCQQSYTDGYNAISFSFKGPAGGSLGLELQTATDCNTTDIISSYIAVDNLTGETQTVTATLSQFVRSNLDTNVDAINAIVFADFNGEAASWQLSKIQFECDVEAPPETSSAPPAPSTTPAPPPATSLSLTRTVINPVAPVTVEANQLPV